MMKVPSTVITDNKADKFTIVSPTAPRRLDNLRIGDDLTSITINLPETLDYTSTENSGDIVVYEFGNSFKMYFNSGDSGTTFPAIWIYTKISLIEMKYDLYTHDGRAADSFDFPPASLPFEVNAIVNDFKNFTAGTWLDQIHFTVHGETEMNLIDAYNKPTLVDGTTVVGDGVTTPLSAIGGESGIPFIKDTGVGDGTTTIWPLTGYPVGVIFLMLEEENSVSFLKETEYTITLDKQVIFNIAPSSNANWEIAYTVAEKVYGSASEEYVDGRDAEVLAEAKAYTDEQGGGGDVSNKADKYFIDTESTPRQERLSTLAIGDNLRNAEMKFPSPISIGSDAVTIQWNLLTFNNNANYQRVYVGLQSGKFSMDFHNGQDIITSQFYNVSTIPEITGYIFPDEDLIITDIAIVNEDYLWGPWQDEITVAFPSNSSMLEEETIKKLYDEKASKLELSQESFELQTELTTQPPQDRGVYALVGGTGEWVQLKEPPTASNIGLNGEFEIVGGLATQPYSEDVPMILISPDGKKLFSRTKYIDTNNIGYLFFWNTDYKNSGSVEWTQKMMDFEQEPVDLIPISYGIENTISCSNDGLVAYASSSRLLVGDMQCKVQGIEQTVRIQNTISPTADVNGLYPYLTIKVNGSGEKCVVSLSMPDRKHLIGNITVSSNLLGLVQEFQLDEDLDFNCKFRPVGISDDMNRIISAFKYGSSNKFGYFISENGGGNYERKDFTFSNAAMRGGIVKISKDCSTMFGYGYAPILGTETQNIVIFTIRNGVMREFPLFEPCFSHQYKIQATISDDGARCTVVYLTNFMDNYIGAMYRVNNARELVKIEWPLDYYITPGLDTIPLCTTSNGKIIYTAYTRSSSNSRIIYIMEYLDNKWTIHSNIVSPNANDSNNTFLDAMFSCSSNGEILLSASSVFTTVPENRKQFNAGKKYTYSS